MQTSSAASMVNCRQCARQAYHGPNARAHLPRQNRRCRWTASSKP